MSSDNSICHVLFGSGDLHRSREQSRRKRSKARHGYSFLSSVNCRATKQGELQSISFKFHVVQVKGKHPVLIMVSVEILRKYTWIQTFVYVNMYTVANVYMYTRENTSQNRESVPMYIYIYIHITMIKYLEYAIVQPFGYPRKKMEYSR